ncbi:ABC transporter ATP-binding protein [Mycena indigotica]|uniref:ABC transporter ATP-binding protein n=1 Tax=Mycena indigotica TaxID=2126181 RepID=A0A8H6VYV7_9AGAR|nr:ABC transporter ATP-binding protein [Mycena indigotica]KAF7298862.1 ABC transporter ATP-binding protein [Mycena indigotica]
MTQKVEDNVPKSTPTSSLREVKLGVWRILTENQKTPSFATRWEKMIGFMPTLRIFFEEVYSIEPRQMTLILVVKIWSSLEDLFLLHLSTRILAIIEIGLKEGGKPNSGAIMRAVAARMLLVAFTSYLNSWSQRTNSAVESRVQQHFEDKIFTAKLEADMPATHDTTDDDAISPHGVWNTFMTVVSVGTLVLQVVAILGYILNLSTSTRHGPIFVFLCICRPLFKSLYRQDLWNMPFVVEADNDDYVRLQALKRMGEDKYRQDIISGDIGEYIVDEYEQVQNGLADTSLEHPLTLWDEQYSWLSTAALDMLDNLPMVYYAASAFLDPAKFTLSKIATLQRSEWTLRNTFSQSIQEVDSFARAMTFIERLYKFCSPLPTIKDGVLKYPSSGEADRAGMSIELRNVTFSYPGGEKNAKALDDVSFTIKSGQLVVLVGSNGSGKSTIVKLLSRLYDVSSGNIVVDDKNIHDYLIADLRAATASLTQDHHLYPLSLGENIGLGNPELMGDVEVITGAAKKGGAADAYTMHVQASDGTPLAKEVEKMQKRADISGGERQRVVASRTFMRFTTGRVKLVIADEGSSALDPEAEWELFNNLRVEREGKTMIFVTHRFGHLTKYADNILCMKEGKLVESGTHEELMKLNGEYTKLYEIQAKAFEDNKL